MKTQVIIFNVSHYDMGDNRGLSVRVLGDETQTNNKLGVDISDATVPDYNELKYLQGFNPKDFPAKFDASLSLTTIKDKNGKEKTGVALKNLEFVCSMEFVEKKVAIAK